MSTFLDPELRAHLAITLKGQPGPQRGFEESVACQTLDTGEEVVTIYTTRGATVADLCADDRPIFSVILRGDTYQIRMPADEYKPGGVLSALKRHSNMSEEDRKAAGDRLRLARAAA